MERSQIRIWTGLNCNAEKERILDIVDQGLRLLSEIMFMGESPSSSCHFLKSALKVITKYFLEALDSYFSY